MTDELIAAMLAVAPDAAALDRLAELAEDEEGKDEEEEVGESASASHHPAVLAAMLRAAESEDWAAVDRLAAMSPGEVRAVVEGGAVAESYTAREYTRLVVEYRAGLVLKAVGTGKNGKPVKRWVRAEPLPARDPNKPKRDVVADAKAAKADREPGRQAAREAWRKAVSGGGGDPAELAAHLRLLTRDELRQMNRDLANQLGGVKEDHVTRLLTHAGAVGPQQSPTTGVDNPTTVGNTAPVPPQSAGANTGGGGMRATTTAAVKMTKDEIKSKYGLGDHAADIMDGRLRDKLYSHISPEEVIANSVSKTGKAVDELDGYNIINAYDRIINASKIKAFNATHHAKASALGHTPAGDAVGKTKHIGMTSKDEAHRKLSGVVVGSTFEQDGKRMVVTEVGSPLYTSRDTANDTGRKAGWSLDYTAVPVEAK